MNSYPFISGIIISRMIRSGFSFSATAAPIFLGIPSPKDDIDGSQVGSVYWNDKDLERIVTYCQKDVVTVMQILLKLKNQTLLTSEEVLVT